MEDLTPEEWAYHRAEYRLHPWGNDYERTSLLLSHLLNFLMRMAPHGSSEEPIWLPDDAFVPFRQHQDEIEQQIEDAIEGLEEFRLD